MASKSLPVAEKVSVYTVNGRPYQVYVPKEGEERPATAIDAVAGARVRVLVPFAFPAHNAS